MSDDRRFLGVTFFDRHATGYAFVVAVFFGMIGSLAISAWMSGFRDGGPVRLYRECWHLSWAICVLVAFLLHVVLRRWIGESPWVIALPVAVLPIAFLWYFWIRGPTFPTSWERL